MNSGLWKPVTQGTAAFHTATIIWLFACIVSNWLNPSSWEDQTSPIERLSFAFQRIWIVTEFSCTSGKSWPSSLFPFLSRTRSISSISSLCDFLSLVIFPIFCFHCLLKAALWLLCKSFFHTTNLHFGGKCLPVLWPLSQHQKKDLSSTSASWAKVYACPANFSATGQSLTVYLFFSSEWAGSIVARSHH